MIRGFLTGALLIICGICIYLGMHLGVLKPVTIKEEVRGPYYLLYQKHLGEYYKISEVIDQVERSVRQDSLSCDQTFGEYFDNPKVVEQDRLRSRGGCISPQAYTQTPKGLESDQLPERRYVVATFSGSPAIGPWKVYPKVQDYLRSHRLNALEETIEIYTVNGDTITTDYLFPLK